MHMQCPVPNEISWCTEGELVFHEVRAPTPTELQRVEKSEADVARRGR